MEYIFIFIPIFSKFSNLIKYINETMKQFIQEYK